MIYGIGIAFLVGMLLGGSWMKEWKDGQLARHEQAQAAAQAKIDDAARAATQEAENKIIDMEAAYLAGEANAKTITRTIYVKGQQNVAAYPVFRNADCVLPPVLLSDLNRARAGVRAPADTGEPAASVPAAGAVEGRPAGNAVPASPGGHGAVGGVPAPATVPSGAGQVPGSSVRPVPKPKPVG